MFVIKCLCIWQCEYIKGYRSYWPSALPALLRRFPSHTHRCVFWKPASLNPLQMKSPNAKTDRLTLEATASLFTSRTQLHSFPLHRGGREWSCACFTSLSTARQRCESATAIHPPGSRVFVHFLFSSGCGRCLTLATDISCPGTDQVQHIKQQQQPPCLKPSKDPDTILPTDGWSRAMAPWQPLTWVTAGVPLYFFINLCDTQKFFRSGSQNMLFTSAQNVSSATSANRNESFAGSLI